MQQESVCVVYFFFSENNVGRSDQYYMSGCL